MASEVDIANLALYHAGSSQRVTTLDESEAPPGDRELVRKVSFAYPFARDRLLEIAPWGFARKSVAAALVTDTTYPGYGYVYEYPSDCIHLAAVCDAGGVRMPGWAWFSTYQNTFPSLFVPPRVPFQVGSRADGNSNVVMTDIASAYLLYCFRQTKTATYSSLFVDALAWELGHDVALTLNTKQNFVDRCDAQRQVSLSKAMTQLMNEAQQDPEADSPSISVRC
jgi:hypothetical protein